MKELRCGAKKHAELVAPTILEVKCGSRFCGARDGAVVLHQFDTTTGELIKTSIFKDPHKERSHHGSGRNRPPVRSA